VHCVVSFVLACWLSNYGIPISACRIFISDSGFILTG